MFGIDNQRISVPMRQSINDAIRLRDQGLSAAEITEKLMADKFNTSIYIMLDTLYYLKKGGRITPAAAAIGTLLKIKPVLTIQGEKLDAFAKARTTQQGRHMMIEAIKKDIDTRFGGMNEEAKDRIMLAVAYTKDRDRAESFKQEIMEAFPGFGEPYLDPLPLSIACHTGPGALGMACTQKIEYLKQ